MFLLRMPSYSLMKPQHVLAYPIVITLYLIPSFRVGFPIMIGSIIVTTGYLLVSHSLFAWH